MIPLQPTFIGSWDKGLQTDKKPHLLADNAFSRLENAFVYRERTVKRAGIKVLGRLRRVYTATNLTQVSGANTTTVSDLLNDASINVRATEPNGEIELTGVTIVIGAATFTVPATPNGTLTCSLGDVGSTINYQTGRLVLNHNGVGAGNPITISFNYYPSLPVMGLPTREVETFNDEQLIAFDTKYSYLNNGVGFIELPSTLVVTWNGTDHDFFWSCNYRGATADSRLFFATNFVNDANNPIRYYDGTTWSAAFQPIVADAPEFKIYQAKLIVAYYGRLLFLNVWEGSTAGGIAGSTNIFNRCRFSQIGSPIQSDAWRSDIFGKGGFIDAPINEEIVSAKFFKNTLIVHFERSTWQLRYVGEYGLPFIWERISSDFGSDSTFSSILFDQGVLTVGDRAITISAGTDVKRIDESIPDAVFNYRNADNGPIRVHGIRDFQRELVFWSYSDSQLQKKFPNKVQVYNYRNQTWATFRDNVTAFGVYQLQDGVSWDSTTVFWDDEEVTWDDPDTQEQFPLIVSGNQEGWIHYYGYTTPDQASLSITSIALTNSPNSVILTVKNHNLDNEEVVYLTGLLFVDGSGSVLSTNLNDKLYSVIVVDSDTVQLAIWDTTNQLYGVNFSFTPVTTATYQGGGTLALMPRLYVATKDFNPYQAQGQQLQTSYIDFLMQRTNETAMTVQLFVNTSLSVQNNLLVGNKEVPTYTAQPYYVPESDIAWHRFFASAYGQYIRIIMTYDDDLMNTMSTHNETWGLNGFNLWARPAGKINF